MTTYNKTPVELFAVWLDRHPCPPAGSGVHPWLYSAALAGKGLGVDPDTLSRMIQERMTRPPNSSRELSDTINKACGHVFPWSPTTYQAPRKLPHARSQATADVYESKGRARGVVDRSDLWGLSPVPVYDELTEVIISTMFGPEELICCTQGFAGAQTAPRQAFEGKLKKYSHLVPSPMSKLAGINQEGKESARCLDNTADRRFLVVEFDKAPSLHAQAQRLWGLSEHLPLALVLFSGKKSLHGWYYVGGVGELLAMKFHTLAVACGADPQMGVRCQIARMPDAIRADTGAQQGVQYWNPNFRGGVH